MIQYLKYTLFRQNTEDRPELLAGDLQSLDTALGKYNKKR
jgi:hypothetical protein